MLTRAQASETHCGVRTTSRGVEGTFRKKAWGSDEHEEDASEMVLLFSATAPAVIPSTENRIALMFLKKLCIRVLGSSSSANIESGGDDAIAVPSLSLPLKAADDDSPGVAAATAAASASALPAATGATGAVDNASIPSVHSSMAIAMSPRQATMV